MIKTQAQIFQIQKVDFKDEAGLPVKFDKVTYGIPNGKGFDVGTARVDKNLNPDVYITGKPEDHTFTLLPSGKLALVL